MLNSNKDILHELVTVGYYGILISGLVLGGILILKGIMPNVPISPTF